MKTWMFALVLGGLAYGCGSTAATTTDDDDALKPTLTELADCRPERCTLTCPVGSQLTHRADDHGVYWKCMQPGSDVLAPDKRPEVGFWSDGKRAYQGYFLEDKGCGKIECFDQATGKLGPCKHAGLKKEGCKESATGMTCGDCSGG